MDGSHIDVDRHLPLRCHLINLGGCAITYGTSYGCQLFNEPTLAVDDADLYLRSPDDARGETLIAGPLLGALRTVREVERLADAVENLPDDRPVLALLDGTLAFWDLQQGNYPRYVADVLIAERLQPALARLRAASTNRRPVAGALRLMLCERFRFLVRGTYDSKAGNAHRPTGCRVHARPQLCQSHPVSRRQSGLPAWRLVYFCVLAYYGGVSNSDCRMPTRGQC